MEGAFEGRKEQVAFARGDRADVVRHKDNLSLEGEFTKRVTSANNVMKGERAAVVKHRDNLKMEGSFEGRKRSDAKRGKPVNANVNANGSCQ